MGLHENTTSALVDGLPRMRRELQALCESECIGGAARLAGDAPMAMATEAAGEARVLVQGIQAAEALVGRPDGDWPAWLDQLVLGNRDIQAVEVDE
jgi:hypothetical protein